MAGLVLAAGGGSRMGRPKALIPYGGQLLVERACRLLGDAGCAPVLAVLGAAADEVRAAASLPGVTCVRNPDWRTGMGSSLRVGLAALPADADAVVVTLVDTPLLGVGSVRRLAAAWQAGAAAAVATYGGEPGHPVLLSRAVLSDVAAAATGDRGARAWLAAHPDRVTKVACDGTGDPRDLDVPEDLDVPDELAGRPAEEE